MGGGLENHGNAGWRSKVAEAGEQAGVAESQARRSQLGRKLGNIC